MFFSTLWLCVSTAWNTSDGHTKVLLAPGVPEMLMESILGGGAIFPTEDTPAFKAVELTPLIMRVKRVPRYGSFSETVANS